MHTSHTSSVLPEVRGALGVTPKRSPRTHHSHCRQCGLHRNGTQMTMSVNEIDALTALGLSLIDGSHRAVGCGLEEGR